MKNPIDFSAHSPMANTLRPNRWIVLLGLSLWVAPAHAYIDPGIGSIIFQGLLAGLVTIAAFWRTLKHKVQEFFSGRSRDDDTSEGGTGEKSE